MIFDKIQCLFELILSIKVKIIKHTATKESNVLDQQLFFFNQLGYKREF